MRPLFFYRAQQAPYVVGVHYKLVKKQRDYAEDSLLPGKLIVKADFISIACFFLFVHVRQLGLWCKQDSNRAVLMHDIYLIDFNLIMMYMEQINPNNNSD